MLIVLIALIFVIGGASIIRSALRGAIKPSDHVWGKRPPAGKPGASERRAYIIIGSGLVAGGIAMLVSGYRYYHH